MLGEAPGASVEFDLQGVNQAVSAGWTGLTPGFVGLDQVNVQVPATVREGCAVPIQVWYGVSYGGLLQVLSQPVTIAIMQGGGPCADPPSAGYGQITWQKIVNTTELSAVTETDMVTAALQASPGMLAPPAPVYIDGCPPPTGICDVGPGIPTSMTLLGPACPVAGYRSLAAGTVTMQGPNLGPAPVPLVPQQGPVSGLSVYQATLPAGALQTGSYTLTANGGADVGAFQATIQIGADIRIQTPLGELDVFSDCKPLTISWTGGDPKSWVTARLVFQHADGSQSTEVPVRTRTANGTLTDPGSARVRLLDGSFGTY